MLVYQRVTGYNPDIPYSSPSLQTDPEVTRRGERPLLKSTSSSNV